MTVQTAEQTTYQVEFSYEAVTLDYLSPKWYSMGEPTAEKAEAEAMMEEARQTRYAEGTTDMCWRVREIRPRVYVDEDAAANAQYWADRARAAKAQEEAEERYMQRTKKGMPVRVVKGRKVPVGTEGWVFWSGVDQYSRTGGYRIGLKDSSGETHWTSADNVEVIEEVAA